MCLLRIIYRGGRRSLTIPFTPIQIVAMIGLAIFIIIVYNLGLAKGWQEGSQETLGLVTYILEQTGLHLKIVEEESDTE